MTSSEKRLSLALLLSLAAVISIVGGPFAVWAAAFMFLSGLLGRDPDWIVAAGAAGLGLLMVALPTIGFPAPASALPGVLINCALGYAAGVTAATKTWK